jgi:SAM-dependent methyltransferase
MRALIKDVLGELATALPVVNPIFEFGSLQVVGQEGFADLRPIYAGREYVGCDMRAGPGVDRIVDLHHLDLPDGSVGTALLMDTLEHVEFPRQAIHEVHRVLKPDGILVASSVMAFPIHDHPYDYWRFTPEGFSSLLSPLAWHRVWSAGDEGFPHTVLGIGVKRPLPTPIEAALERLFARWSAQWHQPARSRWRAAARLAIPPGLLLLADAARRTALRARSAAQREQDNHE